MTERRVRREKARRVIVDAPFSPEQAEQIVTVLKAMAEGGER